MEQKDMSWVEENKPYIFARGFHQITCGAYARPGLGKCSSLAEKQKLEIPAVQYGPLTLPIKIPRMRSE